MKRFERIISFLLAVIMVFGILPPMVINTEAAETLNYVPYPKVEYGYSDEVSVGTIRYIAQNRGTPYFYADYWPTSSFGAYAKPETECGTACISMALSYVGVNKTPKALLEAEGVDGYTWKMWGTQGDATSEPIDKSTAGVSAAMDNYINGKGKYSPLCVYIKPFGPGSDEHWVLLVGKTGENKYVALNPWYGTTTFDIQINGTTASYLGRTNPIDSINQWHNPNVSVSHIKQEFPSYGRIRITKDGANEKTMPCSVNTDPESQTVYSPQKDQHYLALGLVLNDQDNYWYRVKSLKTGEDVYLYSGDVKWIEPYKSDVTIDVNAPTSIVQSNVYELEGTITAKFNSLYTIGAFVYPGNTTTGTAATGERFSVSVPTHSYPISKLDPYVEFDKLPTGNYTLSIEGSVISYYATDPKNKAQTDPMGFGYQSQFTVTKAEEKPVIYTINLYPNGASDANSSFTVVKGNSIGTLPTPRFDNMSFEGWYTEPFGGSKVTTATVPTGDMNLYAHYTYNYASQTKLEFDANGGTLPGPVTSEQINGVNMWRSTASLVVYNQSGTTVNTNENGVEAAIDANGRVVAIREEYDTGNKLTVPEGGFVISGHVEHVDGGVIGGCHFVWSVIRSPDAYVALDYETGTVTLYDSHAGYLAATKMCGDYTRYGDLPVPTRSGYVFQGWTVDGYDAAYYSGYGGYKLKASWAAEDDIYRADEMVYNGHLYERYDSIVSWTKAKELCEAKGGHLVTITDADEQSAVAAFAAKGKRGIYRIGATDEGSEGTWRWVTGEPFAYNNWDKSTPEPSNGDGENYANIVAAALSLHNKEVGEWFDDADVKHTSSSGYYDLSNTGFICEYEYDNTCDHAYSYSVQKEPTEKASGVLRYKCSSCGDYTDSTLPALNKSDYIYSVSSAPGCTDVGTGTYMWTTDSGDTFDFSVSLPATGHSYTSKYTEASCDSYGYTTYTCSACGDSYVEQDEEGWSNWSETYPSNASKVESRTEYRYQDKETTTSTQSSMPGWELYHTTSEWGPYGAWSEWDDDAITEKDSTKVETRTVYGYKYFLCPHCGAHMHGTGTCYSWAGGCGKSFSGGWHEIWSPVSWDAAGLKDWHGTGDYYTYLDGELVFKWKESSSKTQYRSCTREKVNTYHFYRWADWSDWSATQYTAGDNRKVETRTVYRYLQELPGHSYSYKVTKKPTEAAAGTLTGTCGSCGATTTVTLPKLMTADYSYKVTKAASCNAEGTAQYTWKTTTYGSFSFDVTLSKSDHNYTGKVTAPNCTEKGYTTHTCSGCGDSYVDTYVNALGHDYKDGICTRCGVKDPDYVETIAGTCGENLTWTLDQDGTLTISGTGDMTDFAEGKQAWAEHMDDIRYVVVENGVSSISKIAFAGCSSLETVRIPDSVSTIGRWAFQECTNLTEVKIGNGVTVIDKNTFIGCSSLKTVTLGNKVEEIAYSAFNNCEALENINFPDSLKKIDRYAFFRCESLKTVTLPKSFDTLIPEAFLRCAQLKRINVVAGNTTYCSVDGVVYLKDQTVVVAVPNGLEGSLTVLEGVTTIAESAFFYCDKLSEVVLPDSLEQIGVNAFCQCRALTRMNIPGNVTLVDAGAFYDCKNLKEIKFGKTAPVFQNNVFYGVQATAYYPDGQDSWTEAVRQNYGGNIIWIAYDPCETGHAYENSLTAPNCTEQGYTTHTCSVCGDSYVDTYVDAKGHSYEEGVCTQCGEKDPDYSDVISGSCGENLTWILDKEGKLTISGTGAMSAFTNGQLVWAEYMDDIRHVVVEDGATNIDSSAFSNCSALETVHIADSVSKIKAYAFEGCEKLSEVNFGAGVTIIDSSAFNNCIALEAVDLPNVEQIGAWAFYGCKALKRITFSDSLKKISARAFAACESLESVELPASLDNLSYGVFEACPNLRQINVAEENTVYCSVGGVMYTNTKTTIVAVPNALEGTFVVPENVVTIGENAFSYCQEITEVILPDGLSQIASNAFAHCTGLTRITIPASIYLINSSAFASCNMSEIVFEGRSPTFHSTAFNNTTTTVKYPANESSWTDSVMKDYGGSITWVAYDPCEAGHTYKDVVTEPNCTEQGYTTHTCSVCGDSYVDTYVDAKGHRWDDGEVMTEVTCTKDGFVYYRCQDCNATGSKTIPATGHTWDAGVVTKEPTEKTTGIRTYTCTVCGETKTEEIPVLEHTHSYKDAVTAPTCTEKGYTTHTCSACGDSYADSYVDAIGHNYEGIKCARCGEKNPEIAEVARGTCPDNLTWVLYEDGTLIISGSGDMNIPVNSLPPWRSRYEDDICHLIVEDGVTSIDRGAFTDCSMLQTAVIADTVTRIESAFYNDYRLQSVKLPAGLITIGASAFYNCSGLKEIVIPEGVTEIGIDAFSQCTALTSITIPGTLKTIPGSMLYRCSALTTVEIAEGVREIGSSAFSRCTALEGVELPAGLTVIGSGAFYDCSSLTSINIPDSVTEIGKEAFGRCSALRTITIPKSVGVIDLTAFNGCSWLRGIIFEGDAPQTNGTAFAAGVVATAYYPRNNATWTEEVMQSFGGTITWIPDEGGEKHFHVFDEELKCECGAYGDTCGTNVYWVLDGDGLLTIFGSGSMKDSVPNWSSHKNDIRRVVIEKGIKNIGYAAFSGCTQLEDIQISETVTSIGSNVFYGCTALKSIHLPEKLTKIGSSAFYGCTALDGIVLPQKLTTIGRNTFYGCTSLTTIVIPDTVTSIQSYAFFECTSLTSVTLPKVMNSIGTYAFCLCSDLTTINLPDGITAIKQSTFGGCKVLSGITIPDSVTTIEQSAFSNCTSLPGITIPDSVTTIGSSAFNGCKSFTSIVIPDSVTSIGSGAFGNCKALTSVKLPVNFTTIGGWFSGCSALEEFRIADNVEIIGQGAFQNCTALRRITIPKSVKKINAIAFKDCTNLTEIYFKGDAPEFYSNNFSGVKATAYYPENNTTWTKTVMKNYGGTISWVSYDETQEEIRIQVTIPGADKSGAAVTAPEGGWVEGTNTFTVSCDNPCVVAVSYDGGETYVKLAATAADGGYSFSAENMTADTVVAVAVRGDANGDGKITNADVTRLRAAFMGKTTVDSLTQLAIDANGDGKISNADVTRLRAAFFGKTTLSW